MLRVIGYNMVGTAASLAGKASDLPAERFAETLGNAVHFEELGFDGFGLGERHHAPYISSSPVTLLAWLAARTRRIRLFSSATVISILDPVRVAEDYATLDQISGGRVEMMIAKGNGPDQSELFGVSRSEARGTLSVNYELLRQIWAGGPVDWAPPEGYPGPRHSPLEGARVVPAPLQRRIRIWHTTSTTRETAAYAARQGDPIFVVNNFKRLETYREIVGHYRQTFAESGHDPARAQVGSLFNLHVTRNSQDAYRIQREIFDKAPLPFHDPSNVEFQPVWKDFDDWYENSSILAGSPQQVLEKLHRYQEAYGFGVIAIPGQRRHLSQADWLTSTELFASEVRPAFALPPSHEIDWTPQ